MAAPDVDGAVQAAHAAFESYRRTTPGARAALLSRWAALIRARSADDDDDDDDLARILVCETGKPLAEARAELRYAASFVAWFAAEAERVEHLLAKEREGEAEHRAEDGRSGERARGVCECVDKVELDWEAMAAAVNA